METEIKRKIKFMDAALVFVFTCVVVFIVVMIAVFLRMGAVPDTLIVSVFAFFGLECGVMGWIKTTKTKLEDELNGKSNDVVIDQLDDDQLGDRSDQEDVDG